LQPAGKLALLPFVQQVGRHACASIDTGRRAIGGSTRRLGRVRAWLDPWTCLWRWWQAWSTAPPPPPVQALLHAAGTGHPLRPYFPE
jgi:hypothetical protein